VQPFDLPRAYASRGQHDRFLEWFFDEVDRARLHRLNRDGDVAVPGHDNHRQADAALAQRLLDFESAHLGHAHVEQDAAGGKVHARIEQFGSRGISLHHETRSAQHEAGRAADGFVVVDQVNQAVVVRHRCPRDRRIRRRCHRSG